MLRIAVVFLFAGTLGALLGGSLTHGLIGNDIVVASANVSAPAAHASQAKGPLIQASLNAPRHLAMLGTRKNSQRAARDMLVPVGLDDLSDDITVAPRSHKQMIAARRLSARMAISGG